MVRWYLESYLGGGFLGGFLSFLSGQYPKKTTGSGGYEQTLPTAARYVSVTYLIFKGFRKRKVWPSIAESVTGGIRLKPTCINCAPRSIIPRPGARPYPLREYMVSENTISYKQQTITVEFISLTSMVIVDYKKNIQH